MQALLVPVGRDRFELYAEPPQTDEFADAAPSGRVRRWIHAASEQWGAIVDAAREDGATGRWARWRDEIVCRLADSIDEQRALWALRKAHDADLLHPAGMDPEAARAAFNRILQAAQRHHGQWLVINLTLFVLSGILFFIPGPNIVAYYLGFRAFGHLQSWRGARQALAPTCRWHLHPSEAFTELGRLAGQPEAVRAARVAAAASQLELPHLAAFFERASR